MRHSIRLTLMIGIAAGALMMVAGDRGYTQGVDPNAAPNPYQMLDSWAQLPADRKFGGVIKTQVDHSDGKSMWVFDRCGSNECTNSTVAPLMKFDASGKFERAIGGGLFAVSHALYVDRDGNVWAGDQIARNGKGADLIKFSPDGKVLMTIGKPGMPGNAPGYLSSVSCRRRRAQRRHLCRRRARHRDQRPHREVREGRDIRRGLGQAWQGGGPDRHAPWHRPRFRRDKSTWPTASTTASRFSRRTASSSPNGSSSAGRATSSSTRTT